MDISNSSSNSRSEASSSIFSLSSSPSRNRREGMLLNLVAKDARRYWPTLPLSLQKSKKFILQALTKSKSLPSKTEFERKWDISLRQDRDVVLAWARRSDFVHRFHERHLFLPGPLASDKDVIMAYCQKIPRSLQEASEELCDDSDVVEAAIQCNGLELQYGSLRLQQDYELVKKACTSNGEALVLCPYGCEARRRLLEDTEFMHDVVLKPKFAKSKSSHSSSKSNKNKRRWRDPDAPDASTSQFSSSSTTSPSSLYTYHTTTSVGSGRIWKMIPRDIRMKDRRLVLQALKSGLAFRDIPLDMLYLKQNDDKYCANINDRGYDLDFVKSALTGNPALYLQFPPRLCEMHHPELALHTLRSVRTFMDDHNSTDDNDTVMTGHDENLDGESNSNDTDGRVDGDGDGGGLNDDEEEEEEYDYDEVDASEWCRDVIVKAFELDRVQSGSDLRPSSTLLRQDRDAVLVLCKYGALDLLKDIISHTAGLNDDLEIMKIAVRRKPSLFNHVSDRLKQVPEIMIYSITPASAYDTIRSLSPSVSQQHPEIVVKCIEKSVATNLRHFPQHIPDQIWADHRDVCVAWIRRKCSVSSVPNLRQKLQNDRDLALELAEYNWEEMRQVGHAMLNDKSFMTRAVERDGRVLCYAEEATRNDFDLLLIAISRHGTQREYTTKISNSGGGSINNGAHARRHIAAAAEAGGGVRGGGNQDRVRPIVALRQARMEQRQNRGNTTARPPRSPPSVHSVFGYMSDIFGFERKVGEKLNLHNGFMYNFLGGIACPAQKEQRQPPAQRSQLPMLDRGADTSRAFKQLIAEFCGVPIGKELKLLRQAQINLDRRRRPNETIMHARPVPVTRPVVANLHGNNPPAAAGAGAGLRFGGLVNLALDDDDDDEVNLDDDNNNNNNRAAEGFARPARDIHNNNNNRNRIASRRSRAHARRAMDNDAGRRGAAGPMRQPPPAAAGAVAGGIENGGGDRIVGNLAANMVGGQQRRARMPALMMDGPDEVVARNVVIGHENPLAILAGDAPVGPVRHENPLAIGAAPERNVQGNANLDNIVADLNADPRAARREREREEVAAARSRARQLDQQREHERQRRHQLHQNALAENGAAAVRGDARRLNPNPARPHAAAAVFARPAPPVGRVEPAPPIAANMRMADLDEYMERANELARQRDEVIRHLGRDEADVGAARRQTRQQQLQQRRQANVNIRAAVDVDENVDDDDEEAIAE